MEKKSAKYFIVNSLETKTDEDRKSRPMPPDGYKVGKRILRRTGLRERRRAAAASTQLPPEEKQVTTPLELKLQLDYNLASESIVPSYTRAPAKKAQRKRCKTLTPKSKQQKSNTALEQDERVLKSIWGREGKSGPFPCIFLPVDEDEFLEDMLADNPRYKSTSQQKPMEYWEKAAADLPVYQGPWKPSRSQNPPLW